jgi:hypothetical protein
MRNFLLLDISRPEIKNLVAASLHPQELTGEERWADVLARSERSSNR